MRVAQHLFYAIAALLGVMLVALQEPSTAVAMSAVNDGAAVCREDQLDRPCSPAIQVAGMMQDGYVIGR